MSVARGAYFGENVDGIVERLVGEQLDDGGWNCEAENGSIRSSFDTTISVLEGLLEYERANERSPDERSAEAIGLVESKQGLDGRWALENTHPGRVHFELDEGEGKPSRWNTLRAMRVLDWAGKGG